MFVYSLQTYIMRLILRAFLSIAFLTILISCNKKETVAKKVFQYDVIQEDYASDWTEIEDLEKKGYGKTIIQKVDSILLKAKDSDNYHQIFKALAYRSRYINQIEEESTFKILSAYEAEIEEAEFPLKNILHSAVGELYNQYLNQNAWRFQNRTKTEFFDPQDLRTWSLERINQKASEHYDSSLINEDELLQFPTSHLIQIINSIDTNTKNTYSGFDLRNNLFDFLGDRALSFYKYSNNQIAKPSNEFNPDAYDVFAPYDVFTQLKINHSDSHSNKFKTLKLFQKLMLVPKGMDLKKKTYFDLERLKHYYAVSKKEKDDLYEEALLSLKTAHPNQVEIIYQLASFYNQQGNKYEFPDTNKRWLIKKAYDLLSSVEGSNSYGVQNCKALKSQIENKNLSFTIEEYNLPKEPLLFKVDYKNLDKLYARVVSSKGLKIEHANNYYSNVEVVKELLKADIVIEKEISIINPGDFQEHNIEAFINGLDLGKYYLLLSTDKTFNSPKSEVSFRKFLISNISLISRTNSNKNGNDIYVLNRKNGLAVLNAKVEVIFTEYDYNTRKNTEKIGPVLNTNQEGYSFLPIQGNRKNYFLRVSKGKDQVESSSIYDYSRNKEERTNIQTKLFTDRAIYRPGQTVHYKGIVYQSKGNQHDLKKNYQVDPKLFDVNNQEIDKHKLTSNGYGSFEGSFILPSSGLTGRFRIAGNNGSIGFRVEEYKRPTFKVEIDSLSGELELNQNISVSGKVMAFAGNSINDAKVTYRVVRNAEFPYWYFYRGFHPSSSEKEIAKGEIKSDGKGAFQFDFLAQGDASLNKEYQPIYSYNIIIDAVSPNGETQSETKSVRISENPFIISSNLGKKVQLKELQKLIISCKNLSGKKIEKKGGLKLVKLKSPNNFSKPKLWSSDSDLYTKEEKFFRGMLPESNQKKEDLSDLTIDFEINSSAFECNKTLDLYNDLKPGAYELNITVPGKNGQTTSQKNRFVLINPKVKDLAMPVFTEFNVIKNEGEPGEKASFLIGSSLKDLRLLYEVEHEGKIVSKNWISLNNEQKLIEIPIEEKHRGGFSVHFIGIHSNRVIKFNERITVPFTNKKLNLKLTSFRDKVKPGSKEEWSIEVSGMDNTKVQSELLLSMYDQSLDQFTKEEWGLNPFIQSRGQLNWNTHRLFNAVSSTFYGPHLNTHVYRANRVFPSLNWFGFYLGGGIHYRGGRSKPMMMSYASNSEMEVEMEDEIIAYNKPLMEKDMINNSAQADSETSLKKKSSNSNSNPIRTNFNETAFFYPQIETDKNGKASFKFSMPDALTEWKFRAFAHSESFATGALTQSILTQKELMVFPNAPRFFREGDVVEFSSLISNLSKNPIDGKVKIRFFNSFTNEPIQIISDGKNTKEFALFAGNNLQISWSIKIPEGIKAISYRIEAETETFSDGEEKAIPVLLNRMLVTESLPLAMRANQEKVFSFEKLKNSGSANNLSHHSLSLEFTPNPVWYAIQALPYISESNSECSEQIFTRLYANSIAEHIAKSQPKVQKIFEQWKAANSLELVSKLDQNQDLKTALIEETPWLKEAQSETEQKRKIALLFDFNKMASEKALATKKLIELQTPNGGWAWFKGMHDSRYITQYIVSGFGHLNELGISDSPEIIEKAIQYLDARILEDYERLLKHKSDLEKQHIGYNQIQYLYARSFFKGIPLPKNQKAFNYYLGQAEKFWLKQNKYMKGMTALALNRYKPASATPKAIIKSLAENAILDEEMGMYWKDNTGGYYWHNAKIETQALLIEAFDEVGQDLKLVDELKLWLLKQKQTQAWPTSKSTAEACYALLMRGSDLIQQNGKVVIQIGNIQIDSEQESTEAGTGYFKKVWSSEKVNAGMGEIMVNNQNKSAAWGAIYWQYYQNLNDITSAKETGLKLNKTIFKEVIKNQGPVLIPISSEAIELGDKIVMRLRLESDRDLEFVHLKDMRASGFEPINVLSGYRYQDGLGYYESTKDASSNFYMDYLNKGVYVFEYAVRATVAGEFSNGISTIQCQYAPEFSSHSKGQLVKIVR